MTSERRSVPIMILSLALSNSSMLTVRRFARAAISAASLTRFARSAPEKPGVPRAMTEGFTFVSTGTLRMCTFRICSRPRTSGSGTTTWRSKRPGRSNAGSSTSGRLVAAMTMTPSLPSKPSISTSSWFRRLLALVMAAAQARAAVASNRIDLVDEDDARGVLLRLIEHVAHARCADADEHLDEVGAGDREERHLRFARNGPRQQGLAGARGTDHQHALGDLAAEALELRRIFQEVDDLDDLFFRLLDARNVSERDADLILAEQPRAALAKRHRAAATRPHPAFGA